MKTHLKSEIDSTCNFLYLIAETNRAKECIQNNESCETDASTNDSFLNLNLNIKFVTQYRIITRRPAVVD